MCYLAMDAALIFDENTGEILGVQDEQVLMQMKKLMGAEFGSAETLDRLPSTVTSLEFLTNDSRWEANMTAVATLPLKQRLGNRLCNAVLHSLYMGTSNSSAATRSRAERLAAQAGAYHTSLAIDTVTESLSQLFALVFGKKPKFEIQGGSMAEDLALQNIQARVRMVIAYLSAQLIPWVRGRRG